MNKISEKSALMALCVCAMAGLTACEQMVLDNDVEVTAKERTAGLSVITRADGEGEAVSEARLYILDQSGDCVQMLSTETGTGALSTRLPAGTYQICAVGGEHLDRLELPLQREATTTSAITLKEGQEMGDLLLKRQTVTLKENENQSLSIALERKVISIDAVEISRVPADVTAVQVTLASFYGSICLDGSLLETPLTALDITLDRQADGTTWKAAPQLMSLPSKGSPTITVHFTTENGAYSYTYDTDEPLTANHHYNIGGVFNETQPVTLSCLLTGADWAGDADISFDFDKQNTVYNPVAGAYCNGWYVVSVDADARTAVLLSKKVAYDVPADRADNDAWEQTLTEAMAAFQKPANITGNWRFPTVAEVKLFTGNPDAVTYSENGYSPTCFCKDEEDTLIWAYTRQTDGTYTFTKGTTDFRTGTILLRPVMDINY